MKNKYHESHIMKSIDEVGFRETDKIVEENPKLKTENAELRLENQELKVENATQKQLIDALKQLNESKDETIKAKDQTIEILMKCSTTEERYRDEESEFSKFCLNLQ
ncbi:hypothetical protein ACQJ9K_07715 [Helicobacter pylori]